MTTHDPFCAVHERPEHWDNESSYFSCFECGHVWQDAAELVADTQRLYDEISRDYPWQPPMPVPEAHDILICPLCSHSFLTQPPRTSDPR